MYSTIKSIVTLILIGLSLSGNTAYGSSFILTEVLTGSGSSIDGFGTSDTVVVTFDGTANGNIVDILGNITVTVNGASLFGASPIYVYSNLVADTVGGAQVSFDGARNNFWFFDVPKPSNPSDPWNWTRNFFDVTGPYTEAASSLGLSGVLYYQNLTVKNVPFTGEYSNYNRVHTDGSVEGTAPTGYSLVAVPEPTTIALLLSGIIGFSATRNKSYKG